MIYLLSVDICYDIFSSWIIIMPFTKSTSPCLTCANVIHDNKINGTHLTSHEIKTRDGQPLPYSRAWRQRQIMAPIHRPLPLLTLGCLPPGTVHSGQVTVDASVAARRRGQESLDYFFFSYLLAFLLLSFFLSLVILLNAWVESKCMGRVHKCIITHMCLYVYGYRYGCVCVYKYIYI